MNAQNEMKNSYLIQRLTKPRNYESLGLTGNPFAFGGGKRNGGLSEDFMKIARSIFEFDYMGSAEFEWGAVPEAFQKMNKHNLSAAIGQIDVDGEIVDIYIIGNTADLYEIVRRIGMWATTEYVDRVKEQPRVYQALRVDKSDERAVRWNPVGWLELNNGFMFFIDEEMFRATLAGFNMELSPISWSAND